MHLSLKTIAKQYYRQWPSFRTSSSSVSSSSSSTRCSRTNIYLIIAFLLIFSNFKEIECNRISISNKSRNNFVPIVVRSDDSGYDDDNQVPLFGDMLRSPYADQKNLSSFRNVSSLSFNHPQKPSAAAAAGSARNVMQLVDSLDARLKSIRNVELGVTIVQEIFDAMDFTTVIRNDSETVTKIANRITRKLQNVQATVTNFRDFFQHNLTQDIRQASNLDDSEENFDDLEYSDSEKTPASSAAKSLNTNHSEPPPHLNTIIQPCPFDDLATESNYNKQQIQILNYLKTSPSSSDVHYDSDSDTNSRIVDEIRRIRNRSPFAHVYFLSRSDSASDPACNFDTNSVHFRHLYLSAIQRKHVFLLIDTGNALNSDQLELSKLFVTNIVRMLSDTDTVTVVTIADTAHPMVLSGSSVDDDEETATDDFVYPCTVDRKLEIIDFIERLNRSCQAPTNHSIGFQYAFELLLRQNLSDARPVQFLYITRGLLSRLTDAMQVLLTIASGQRLLRVPVVIHTCAVVIDEKRIMYERQFLRDIAQQNYSKYEIDVNDWLDSERHNLTGNLYIITKRNPELIIKTSLAVFDGLYQRRFISSAVHVHRPFWDPNSKDTTISATLAVVPYGVVGVDFYLNDIIEDLLYYKRFDDSYAFLVDTQGVTIFHPAFVRPVATTRATFPVDIGYLENRISSDMRRRLLNEAKGNATVVRSANETRTYTWQRVLDIYVVCIVTTIRGSSPKQQHARFSNYQHSDYMSPVELLYHRIDLVPPQTPVCRHFRQIATLDTSTLFLGASAFESPFAYTRSNRENRDNAQSLMAYIKDTTNLLANPGLRPQIRNDVSALYHVMSYLKNRHQDDEILSKYIIRRYATTINGVIQVYPGCVLDGNLEAATRPWYRKAIKYPGRIIVTKPYLDAAGAGYIVTIAHTIFEGKANALHNAERDHPVAIVALDVPYTFLYKLILESTPLCSETNIKCLLIDDEGYLLAHPSWMEPVTSYRNTRRPFEHITHKESFVANDILNHKTLVRKLACGDYQNRTIQRYYAFNTSLADVLSNVVHGERTKYQITAIRGTNLFAAVLNSTCDGGAFCPCSTVDRVCLNCNRMDQTDCECPCECPLKLSPTTTLLDYCQPPAESFTVADSVIDDWDMVLKPCANINCELYATHTDCLAVMGCEWCQLDVDGQPFSAAFCTTQTSCFNGVLGSITPYGDGYFGAAVVEPAAIPPVYSAIGPVGGAIVALCLVVGFAMYCYRQNLEGSTEQIYCDSMPEDNYGVPLSRFNFDEIAPHDDRSEPAASSQHIMHRNLPVDISPYHMSIGGGVYRRPPPPNGESDHGYSTMTPHEDSEHMCFTLVEPLIGNSSKRFSQSADSMSISTSVSSPTNQQDHQGTGHHHIMDKHADGELEPTMTTQLSPHHVLAPVTVHRHMEASS